MAKLLSRPHGGERILNFGGQCLNGDQLRILIEGLAKNELLYHTNLLTVSREYGTA